MSEGLELIPGERSGKKIAVRVVLNGTTVHADEVNPTNAKQRAAFIADLVERIPALTPDTVEGELLKLADALTSTPSSTTSNTGEELDLSCVVRPELFHTPQVSGIAIPVATVEDDTPTARWVLHLRWSDGRRERFELSHSLALPDGKRLWLSPQPTLPDISPSPWSSSARSAWLEGTPAPTAANVFTHLCERIGRYLAFHPETAPGTGATLALWIMLTYGYRVWNAVPYLRITGTLGSGKSRLLDVLQRVVFRPFLTSSATAPTVFRTLHDRGGTFLLDEAEQLGSRNDPAQQELTGMLLAGNQSGGRAARLEPTADGSFRVTYFDVFCPKIVASIAGIPAPLASRCITITMFRSSPDSEAPKRKLDEDPSAWQSLRDDLHALTLELGPQWLGLPHRQDVVPPGITNRNAQLWQPILALAALVEENGASGLLKLVQEHALSAIADNKDDAVQDVDEVLLVALAALILDGKKPTPGEVLTEARQHHDEGDCLSFQTARSVASRLKHYGLKTVKAGGKRAYRTVSLADMRLVERHYGLELIADTASPENRDGEDYHSRVKNPFIGRVTSSSGPYRERR